MKMRSRSLLAALAAVLVLAAVSPGCKSSSGSREFIPGKGWRSL